MKARHRGYEISVTRERCLGGWPLLYYSVVRESDGYIAVESFEDSDDSVRAAVAQMRVRIDNELAEDDPWMEATDAAWKGDSMEATQIHPDYLYNEARDIFFVREDLASSTSEVADITAPEVGYDRDGLEEIVTGPIPMRLAPNDEDPLWHKSCSPEEAEVRYWKVEP